MIYQYVCCYNTCPHNTKYIRMGWTNFPLISLITLLLTAMVCYQMSAIFPWSDCNGAPYLYASFHHKIDGVRKYSRNGCFLSQNVLQRGHDKFGKINEARSVTVGQYLGRDALYVCEARQSQNRSKVVVYGECDARGRRTYLTSVASESTNAGVNHPYGLTFDRLGNVYASFQHTDVVLRFEKDTFRPMPFPSALQKLVNKSKVDAKSLFPGTFIGYVYKGSAIKTGIRDIEWVQNTLWVANEDTFAVSVVDSDGYEIERIALPNNAKPIGIHYNKDYNLVFISTKNSFGAVYGVNPLTKKAEKVFYTEGMTHSTGLISYGSILYVAAQDMGKILSFDIETTLFISVIVEHFPDSIEQISLSWC